MRYLPSFATTFKNHAADLKKGNVSQNVKLFENIKLSQPFKQ